MEFKYGAKAKEQGAYIIGACGLDCIPNDMGLVYAKQRFEGKFMFLVYFTLYSTYYTCRYLPLLYSTYYYYKVLTITIQYLLLL